MKRLLPLAAVFLLAACAPGDEADEGTPPAQGRAVIVTLTEHEIEVDGEITAGTVDFELNNQGDQAHGFVISGNGLDQTLSTDVQPGARDRASVDLEPGTYTVWCPIGDHRDRGMEAEIEVVEAGGS